MGDIILIISYYKLWLIYDGRCDVWRDWRCTRRETHNIVRLAHKVNSIEWTLCDNDLQEASNVREPIFFFFVCQFTAADHGCVTCFSVNVGMKHLHTSSENGSALALVRWTTASLTLNLSLRILLYYVICVFVDWTVGSWLCSSQTIIFLPLYLFSSLSLPLFSEQKTNRKKCVCILVSFWARIATLLRYQFKHVLNTAINWWLGSFRLSPFGCAVPYFSYCSI